MHERIYDVAVSDGRQIGADGRCKTPVGNTVDVPNATYTNTIGDPLLAAYWKDPEFDPKQRAFYYVRVIADSVAALDGLRLQAIRHQDAGLRAHDGYGTGLHLADLVHAGEMRRQRRISAISQRGRHIMVSRASRSPRR